MQYVRFAVIIAVATALIFAISYLNVFETDHLWFSMGRVWMAVAMGAAVAVVVILAMGRSFGDWAANSVVLAAALAAFAASAWLIRNQEGTGDIGFLRGMIPHHSAAILSAERAQIRDPRVRALADRIIAAQQKEIGEMERLIADLDKTHPPADAPVLPARPPQAHTAMR
ncbi:MAG: DUF305 domain-containing protein [Methylocystis sp.]|uniref:DUF305 domain-containing protein n=1 Tax=Methylocystis sp. TaxID=1911079 RepID=UPI003DA6CB52